MDHSKTEHPKTEHENVRFSNGFGIRMFGIRAPTAVRNINFYENGIVNFNLCPKMLNKTQIMLEHQI